MAESSVVIPPAVVSGPSHLRSGFGRDDEWGYRAMEPNRCCITSIALVLLKTGITQPEVSADPDTALPIIDGQPPPMAPGVTVNSNQLATAQKLLLFWRKPAVGRGEMPHELWGDRRIAQPLSVTLGSTGS